MSAAAAAQLSAVDLYGAELLRAASLPSYGAGLRIVDHLGERLPVAIERYLGPSADEERGVLERASGPVLDVGCGPGRHLLALSHLGIAAVGLDISPLAAGIARSRGACVIEASVFDSIPGAGSWGSALLLDGNIGIGGAPAELLERIGDLLQPGGVALVEVEPPGVATRPLMVSLETDEARSEWFAWARLSVDGLGPIADAAGFEVAECWQGGSRWFAALVAA